MKISVGPQQGQIVERQKLHESAKEFESLFYEMVLQSMRQTVMKSGLVDGGNAEDIYRSMLDGEYSKALAAQTTSSLSELIEKQLLEKMGIHEDVKAQEMLHKGMSAYGAKSLR